MTYRREATDFMVIGGLDNKDEYYQNSENNPLHIKIAGLSPDDIRKSILEETDKKIEKSEARLEESIETKLDILNTELERKSKEAEALVIAEKDRTDRELEKIKTSTDTKIETKVTESIANIESSFNGVEERVNTIIQNNNEQMVSKELLKEELNKLVAQINTKEIEGRGAPEGRIEANIGYTYIDLNNTNGALKRIKKTNGGNRGWEVLIGDTGNINIGDASLYLNSKIIFRRVNNIVNLSFGGLNYDLFGLKDKNSLKFQEQNGKKVLRLTTKVPEGFRLDKSIYTGLYRDYGEQIGNIYIGSKNDNNVIRLELPINYPEDGYKDLRTGIIQYITSDKYPEIIN